MTRKSNKAHKVLIVDDSTSTLEVIQRNLTHAGLDAYICSSVRDAVRFLDESTIDIVITDFKMPEQNGLELIKHIRDNCADIEIIMITMWARQRRRLLACTIAP